MILLARWLRWRGALFAHTLAEPLGGDVAAAGDAEQDQDARRYVDEGAAFDADDEIEAGDDEGEDQKLKARQARLLRAVLVRFDEDVGQVDLARHDHAQN